MCIRDSIIIKGRVFVSKLCADTDHEKTKTKKVVSATSSGSVYIVVFKRRFLDVLTLLVEKARRSFFLRGKRSIGKKRPSARSAFLKSNRFARELIDRSIETTAREESRDITIRTVAIERQQQQQR